MVCSNYLSRVKFRDLELINERYGYKYGKFGIVWNKIRRKDLSLTKIIQFFKKHILGDSTEKEHNFIFFKVSNELYSCMNIKLLIEIEVISESAVVTLNEYMNEKRYNLSRGLNSVKLSKNSFEIGENILAYKGQCKVRSLIYDKKIPEKSTTSFKKPSFSKDCKTLTEVAAEYLCVSVINEPKTSPFKGSCYTIYDYDNKCYRMPYWLWSDAPIVSALLELTKKTYDENRRAYYGNIAVKIGNVLINHQIMDRENKHFGALVSRYRYYRNTNKPFDCLLGPNDTSFIVKWALLPLYNYTKKENFKKRSEFALDWVRRIVYEFSFVPSQYYLYEDRWEEGAFVDSGFTPEGFLEYNKTFVTDKKDKYTESADFFMRRFIKQFKLESGFYGIYFSSQREVNTTIFTRGQAWVLEGLLSTYKGTKKQCYKGEAMNLAKLLVEQQNKNGSWAFLLGNNYPQDVVKNKTGVCEKATAILGYLMLNLYTIREEKCFFESGKLALEWCGRNMFLKKTAGYGGIAARSQASGIIGLPYIKVATGYANAFYILGSLLYDELIE